MRLTADSYLPQPENIAYSSIKFLFSSFYLFLSFFSFADVKCLLNVVKMVCKRILIITAMVSVMFHNISSQQCGVDTYSIYQMMLKGQTYKTFRGRPLSMDCREACNSDVRCQSYNYDFNKDICELNNRTKEASPEDFVKDKDRYYITKAPKRGKQTSK